MGITEVKDYLEKELPDFTYLLGTDTPHEENWNSIQVTRDNHELAVDVSKVKNTKHLKDLKAMIEAMWERVEA